jgi:hypothetical protein
MVDLNSCYLEIEKILFKYDRELYSHFLNKKSDKPQELFLWLDSKLDRSSKLFTAIKPIMANFYGMIH